MTPIIRKSRNSGRAAPSAIDLLKQRNKGREPERLAIKYRIMRADPFAFLRGSPDVFYERMTRAGLALEGPPAWLSGDLHLENCGSYLGDNGLAYFDVNDFDAAVLGPAPWDVLRLITSLLIATPNMSLKRGETEDLAMMASEVWLEALRAGKPRWVERRTAEGLIGGLLQGLRRRNDVAFLNSRSRVKKGVRRLKDDGPKMLPLPDREKQRLGKWLHGFANDQHERGFFELVDAARRVAGVDSLGTDRYALLIAGSGSPDGNMLLDLKFAVTGAAAPFTPYSQPAWQSDAHRIVAVQHRCQAVSMGFLQAVTYEGKPFVLRQLQPAEDRLNIADASREGVAFDDAVHTMADLSAWAQLRSSGRQGSADADTLIAFGATRGLGKALLAKALHMEELVLADWQQFCQGFDEGAFET